MSSRGSLGLGASLLASICLTTTGRASAADDDGLYGRFDGDLSFGMAAGVSEAFPGESLTARADCLYLYSLGLFTQYEDGLAVESHPIARAAAFGLEIRPLFLPRFAADLERGPAYLDLWLDSLSFELGLAAAAASRRHCDESCWFWSMQLGAGMDLPLLPSADGPFVSLRGGLRVPTETRPGAETGGWLALSLGYRMTVAAHLADAGY